MRGAGADAIVDVWVTARASHPGIGAVADGRLRVRVAAPALEDRANRELVASLARAVGVPAGRVTVESGATSRRKRVRIEGVEARIVRQKLGISSH